MEKLPEQLNELRAIITYLKTKGWKKSEFKKALSRQELKMMDLYLQHGSYDGCSMKTGLHRIIVYIRIRNLIAKLRFFKEIK